MNIDNKAEKLIILLTKETFENTVVWKGVTPPESLVQGTDDYFPLFLKTTYKNTVIGLYLKRYKHFFDEHEYYWGEAAGLCILDKDEIVIWQYDQNDSALLNLLSAAREQASGINNVLDGLLE